jgi:hypothetical protein
VKTISLKKVSAVAVASLGFGLLSVVPANATTFATVAGTSVAPAANVTVAAGSGAVQIYLAPNIATVNGDIIKAVVTVVAPSGAGAVGTAPSVTCDATTGLTGSVAASASTTTGGITFTDAGTVHLVADTANLVGTCSFPTATIGSYKVVVTPTAGAGATVSATTGSTVTYITAGYSVDTTRANTSLAKQGSNITTGWSVTTGGQATVRLTNFAAAARTYYVTATNASIQSLDVTNGDVATTISSAFVNSTNYAEGATIVTTTGTVQNDWVDVQVVVPASATSASLSVVYFDATTGLQTVFSNPALTIGVVPNPSAQYSLLTLNAGAGTTDTGAAADTTSTTVAKTAGTKQFTIIAKVRDQYNVAYSGVVLGASLSGPGTIGIAGSVNSSATSAGRSLTVTIADNDGEVTVFGDGTAGTTVITITATTSAGVTTVLGSKTVKFAGSPAKATVTQLLNVAKAGTQLGENPSATATTNTNAGAEATSVAFLAKVVDSNTVDVAAGSTYKLTSSDSTVITTGSCIEYTAFPGNFECSVSGAASAISGKTATVTFSILNSTTGLYDIAATPLTFAIGGDIAKVVVTTDKTTYGAGEAVNLTATATDSSGNKAYDGQTPYVTAPASNKTIGGAFPANSVVINNGKSSTTGTSASLFAPSVPGSFLVTGTTTDGVTTTGTAFSITASVTDANAAIAASISALNAKIVALNALIAKIMKRLNIR